MTARVYVNLLEGKSFKYQFSQFSHHFPTREVMVLQDHNWWPGNVQNGR